MDTLLVLVLVALFVLLIDSICWRLIPFARTLVRAKRQRLPEDWFNFIQ